MPIDLLSLTVPSAPLWRQWLLTHHSSSSGVWLTLVKKTTSSTPPITTLTYSQALDQMHESGRAAVEAAKADGRWDAAYAGSKDAELPDDFLREVAKVPKAGEACDGLTRGERYVIYLELGRLKTKAGREKKIKAFVEMLLKGERPASQKQKRVEERKAKEVVLLQSDAVQRRARSGRKVHKTYAE